MQRSKAPSKIFKTHENDEPYILQPAITQKLSGLKILESEPRIPLTACDNASILKAPFRVPIQNYQNTVRMKNLGVRHTLNRVSCHDPNEENALVLYTPPEYKEHEKLTNGNTKLLHVVVDPLLCKILRPHQREGVKFMYECVTGARIPNCHGCIMADDMGLGKTLQTITLMYTLLKQSPRGLVVLYFVLTHQGTPDFSKALIVCPASLVKNWEKEVTKWLNNRMCVITVEGGGKDVIKDRIEKFRYHSFNQPIVLIISYESFRINADLINEINIGIIICDEGHRLKNQDNQIYQALSSLKIQRRVLLSGTPIQNDLLEYFSLVHFVNCGILGTRSEFRRHYETPILRGRDSLATDNEKKIGDEKLQELLQIVTRCIIRRTSNILSNYLPIKTEHVICIRLTPLQAAIYKELVTSKSIKSLASSEDASFSSALAFITYFKKLCNHPLLMCDLDKNKNESLTNIETVVSKYLANRPFKVEDSGKFKFLDYLLSNVKATSKDKVVVVSNYTQTLDLIQQLCNSRGFSYVRLDGTMSIKKRQKIVDRFNDPSAPEFVFMLSSKAGGCGLNLIGANRLIMFDPDWNPANDAQAMARVWRDGQKKLVFIYRLVTTGTIEEKIIQRQAHKKALSNCVVDEQEEVERHFTKNDLRDLFSMVTDTCSTTHDNLKCKRCLLNNEITSAPEGATCTTDLSGWKHAWSFKGLEDTFLKSEAWRLCDFSFIFHQKSHIKQLGIC